MDTKLISLNDFHADLAGVLSRCYDSGQPVVVELPNHGLVSIQPVEPNDDLINNLIEHNPAFRASSRNRWPARACLFHSRPQRTNRVQTRDGFNLKTCKTNNSWRNAMRSKRGRWKTSLQRLSDWSVSRQELFSSSGSPDA